MNDNSFYQSLLDMRGDRFCRKARKDVFVARVVAICALVAGIASSILLNGSTKDILLAACFAVIGAAAAIDGGVRKRMQVWHLFDAVINWSSVEDKAKEKNDDRPTGAKVAS